MAGDSRERIPVLLLKTKSAPTDTYEELFAALGHPCCAPVFVPVLEHRFKQEALDELHRHVACRGFVPASQQGLATYGALIFTSQRAVEAFAHIVGKIRAEGLAIDHLLPPTLPLYVVGPATGRGLRSLELACPILGEDTGNGEALAGFILEHYTSIYADIPKPPILFLVGDKRRDIIPRTLQSKELDPASRIPVDELVVYETGEMQSFKANFTSICRDNAKQGAQHQWVVVFSPTGCEAMLESLDLLDPNTGRVKPTALQRDIFVATIGPTTRDYLVTEFGFTPDVCAAKPSPEGIAEGIKVFEEKNRL